MAKMFAYFVVPNEYGMNDKLKLETAHNIAGPLLEKILNDLMFWKEMKYEDQYWKYKNDQETDHWKHIRTRLYFTSASHIYSVMHLITLGNDRELLRSLSEEKVEKIRKMVYMSYLSHL